MSLKETVYMSGIIKLRRGTAEDLKEIVLALGEPAFETDSYKLKIGDGLTVYKSLGYINDYDDLRKLLDENYKIPQDLQNLLSYLENNGNITALLEKINEIDAAQKDINTSLGNLAEKDDEIKTDLENAIKALEGQDALLQSQINDTKNRIKAIEDLDVASKDYVNETKSFLENTIESLFRGEPIVPINDIYNVFKTYWHARVGGKPALAYSSMLVDTYEPNSSESEENLNPIIFTSPINPDKGDLEESLEKALEGHTGLKDYYTLIAEGGKHNGMYFGDNLKIPRYAVLSKATDRQEIEGKMTTVVTGYNFKYGLPINCSTLSALLTLGIPYGASKYAKDQQSYEIKDLAKNPDYDMRYSFNMYGTDSIINAENYEAYFIARRQLARCRELGLEIPALSQDWWPKYKENEGWYDYIQPTSDLREAQPGDLIFWNTHGENLDPRDVTHVVMVLARLSYDSRNPNLPLLLLAEATSSADLGVLVSYYMYDVSDLKEMVENDDSSSEVVKYILLDGSITNWRYIYDSDSGNYRFSPNTGDYIKIPYYKIKDDPNSYTSGDYVFVKLINNSFIEYTTKVQNACFTDSEGKLILKYFDDKEGKGTEQCDHLLKLKNDNTPTTYIIKRNTEGTRENRIPKFICRPKYSKTERGKTEGYSIAEKLTEYNYSDNPTSGYAIDKDESDSLKITGAFIRSNSNNTEDSIACGEVISLEFDWKTTKEAKNPDGSTTLLDPDAIGEHYLSFMENDALIHSIPYCLPNTKYEKVKFVIPLESQLSSSKGNQTAYIDDTICIQEVVKDKNGNELHRSKPDFDNLKIYKGIIQT